MLVHEKGRYRTVLTHEEHDTKLQSLINSLSPEEQEAIQAIVGDESADDNPVLRAVTELEYVSKPVSPGQFYTDDYYFGHVQYWPKLLDDLVELHEGQYEEAVLTGSLGWGKSHFASSALAYVIYLLTCLRNPQRSYGLDATSTIYLSFVGPTIQLAQRGIYSKVTEFIKGSPYFRDCALPRVIRTQTWFPKRINLIAGSTQSNAGMALDVYGGVIDEANFFTAQRSDSDLRLMLDRAELIYNAVRRRMENRFMRSGRLPGLLVIDSSARHQSSFTVRKIKEAKHDQRIFVRDYATWQVQPKDRFVGRYFYVAVGDNQVRSRIIEDEKEAEAYKKAGANVHEVPAEFQAAFDKDLETAIQDILGLPTADISFYISNHKAIGVATKDNRHPFRVNEYTIGVTNVLYRWDRICDQVEVTVQGGYKEKRWIPKVNPDAPRTVHLDLSKNQDATGIAIGHIERYVEVVRRDPDTGDDQTEIAPIIYIDAMLRIVPPPGRDIILGDVRAIVYAFQEHGFYIYRGTCDLWQSLDTLQQFEAKGLEAEVVSMDKTSEPYDVFKTALYEERIQAYTYKPWEDEMKSLRRIITKGNAVKIDHPKDPKDGVCSKDVADAVAGVVYGLTVKPPGRIMTGGAFAMEKARLGPMGHGDSVDIKQRIEQDVGGPVAMPFLFSDPTTTEDD